MQTRIQKWGNSLALRIPKVFASEVGLDSETLVDISLTNGQLVITPIMLPPLTLEQLLADVTPANLHTEIETGPAIGNEVW